MAQIVLVDDDAFVLYTLRKLLHKAGHAVACFDNGALALAHMQLHPADLLITDVVMPGMGGLDLLAQFRTFNQNARVLVVSAAGLHMESGVREAVSVNGGDAVLVKPFDRSTFLGCVERLLGDRAQGAK